jgi:alkaline phosphatase D
MYKLVFLLLFVAISVSADQFSTGFRDGVDRYFVSPEVWTNPMESWKVRNGRLEVDLPQGNLNAQCLSHQLKSGDGSFEVKVVLGSLGKKVINSAGFRIGIKSELGDYRSALLFGKGLDAGINAAGKIFIGKKVGADISADTAVLTLIGKELAGKTVLVLKATDKSGAELASLSSESEALSGNIALVSDYARRSRRKNKHWFDNWSISGDKIVEHKGQTFGPILWTQYTLSRKTVKMTALLAPVDVKNDNQEVKLEIKKAGAWTLASKVKMHPQSRTAQFRLENWDDSKDCEYRICYEFVGETGKGEIHAWNGTIRKDPVNKKLVVAGFTGNTDPAFPNSTISKNVRIQNPDVLFFSGDQIYEQVGGYGIIRGEGEASLVNYLRKYYLFGWAFRDLMKDRPTIILPDDHDVYQGNVWGNGGNKIDMKDHDKGGYNMFADFVNTVHRTQVSHHPDAHDPTPIKRNISVYYGDMIYGRVSFAVIADRMFKTGPKGLVNDWKGRSDHMKDPNYDVAKLDHPKAILLGKRQLSFLDHWAKNWKGADMKVVLSATIFSNLANYHGPGQMFIQADLDSNGWPQTGRNKALASIRKGFGFMYAGDQHLTSIVHHGVNEQGDAGFSFCVPSIAAGYPRSWRPDVEGRPVKNRINGMPNTGDYKEGFGNMVRVYAIGNPEKVNRKPVLERLHDKASGHGMITLDREKGEIKMDCYRLLFDAKAPQAKDQFPGWPRTVNLQDMYGRKAKAFLPEISVSGLAGKPVFQVIDSKGMTVYTLRSSEMTFRPKVFATGKYTVKVGNPDEDKWKTLTDLEASNDKRTLEVKF